jgi:hypothetical protein
MTTMSHYVVMFPADREADWEAGTEAERQATFDVDLEFGRLLEARGGAVTGGNALRHSRQARTIRRGPNGTALVTDGPYAESTEQLSGYFEVTCPDYDALVDAAEILTRAHPVVVIWPTDDE